ncbi:MAG: BTAD domain-containing putative transcriptional regulator [Chloroflexi bacterium]|nr:BTAD domain-containing putative transcriptional regulator [Chloroflexota bacterium]
MSEQTPSRAELDAEAHADLALHRAVLAEMTARGVSGEVLEEQRENVALANAAAELLRHSEPGHDCARLGCRTDDLVARMGAALIGVPMTWRPPAGDTGAGDSGGVRRAHGASPDEPAPGRRPGRIRVSLLGGFSVTRDGNTLTLPEAEQRLVALVALHRHVGLSWAAARLAPRIEPASAVARVDEAIARLRSAGLDMLDHDGRVLSLAAGVTVDAEDAEAFFSRLARQGGDPRWSADHDRLLQEVLPGWTEIWAQVARQRFEDLSLSALETEIRRLLDGGARSAAATFARKVLRADPFRESTLRLLIEAYLAEGRDALARDCYLAFRRDLLDEFGFEPSPMARELVARLLGEEGSPGDESPD